MDVSADAPCLDCAYKLQEYAGRPRRKRSEAKATWPGRKQVFRARGDDGRIRSDLITLADSSEAGQPRLVPVMRGGRRLDPAEPLDETRRRTASQLETLPNELRALESRGSYPVIISDALRRLAAGLDAAHSRRLATASSTGAG